MSEPFSKVNTIRDDHKYSNIWIRWPSNIVCICICAISQVQIYSDIRLVNIWHLNIFVYSLGKLCGIRICFDICFGPFYDIRSSLSHRHHTDSPPTTNQYQTYITLTSHQHQTNITPTSHRHYTDTPTLCWQYTDITLTTHRHYTDITPSLHRHHTDITPILHRHTNITLTVHRHYTDITPILHRHYTDITPSLHRHYTNITPISHCYLISKACPTLTSHKYNSTLTLQL